METTPEITEIKKLSVVGDVSQLSVRMVTGWDGSRTRVVDPYGWRGLSFEAQVIRAEELGKDYNSLNSGPDYMNVAFEVEKRKAGDSEFLKWASGSSDSSDKK